MLKVTQSRLSRRLLNEIGPTCDYIPVDKFNTVELFLRKVSELKGIFSTPDSARFPPIFFSHMLISNRPGWSEDSVCRSLSLLRRLGKVFCFSLPLCGSSSAFVLTSDLLAWYRKHSGSSLRIEKFIRRIIPKLSGLKIQSQELFDLGLTARDISDLIKAGFLLSIAESVYQPTIPCAGSFSKVFSGGRSAIVSVLKRSSDHELLRTDFLSKDWVCKRMKLPLDYHITDITGLGIADSVLTDAGPLIRLIMLAP